MITPITLAQAIPAKVRATVYSVLATAAGLEVVFDVIPAGVESKVLGALVVLGFGQALANTPFREDVETIDDRLS